MHTVFCVCVPLFFYTCAQTQFATEAAITIMRIDDLIQLEPEQHEGEE